MLTFVGFSKTYAHLTRRRSESAYICQVNFFTAFM